MITDTVSSAEKKSEPELPPTLTETKENGDKTEKSEEGNDTPMDNGNEKKSSTDSGSTPSKPNPAVDSPQQMETDAVEDEATAPVTASPDKKKQPAKKAPPPKKETPKKESPKKEAPSPKPESKKEATSTKSPAPKREKKTESKPEKDADDDEKPAALFDSPLVVQGKRQRHGVDRLTATATPHQVKHTKADIPSGSGTKLADIEYVSALISRTKPDELKHVHRLLFGRPGTSHEIRKNIRAFNGFAFDSGSAEYDKKKAAMEKMTKADLVAVANLLGTEKSKEKTEIITKILDFLLKPADSGRAAPGSKKSKSRKSGTKRKKTTKAKKEKAKSKEGGDESKTAASSGSDATSDEEEDEEEEEEKPAVEEPPAKKAKTTPKKPPASSPKKKKSSPSDSELTSAIKELLKDANLEEVTMKEMCKMVYDKYPDLDLTERKDFIKTTVKSIIAASNE